MTNKENTMEPASRGDRRTRATHTKTDHETVRISGPAVRQLWKYSAQTCIPKARIVSMAVQEFIAARRAKA